MMMAADRSAAQIRLAAMVIAGAFVLWAVMNLVGGALELPPRYAFLIDLAALAALIWALIVVLKVRATRRRDEEGRDARR